MKDPNKVVKYTCTITENGNAPQFVVTPEDSPQEPVIGTSATGAWTHIVKSRIFII